MIIIDCEEDMPPFPAAINMEAMCFPRTGDCQYHSRPQCESSLLWTPQIYSAVAWKNFMGRGACGRMNKWKDYVLKVDLRQTNCESLNSSAAWGDILMTMAISRVHKIVSWSYEDVLFIEGTLLTM